MFKVMGLRTGAIGLMCLAFLFIPVSRGSVLLRYIDIPFEHATRYHVWLGHLTMVLFTVHGLLYVIAWAMEGHLVQEVSPLLWVSFLEDSLYSHTECECTDNTKCSFRNPIVFLLFVYLYFWYRKNDIFLD